MQAARRAAMLALGLGLGEGGGKAMLALGPTTT